MKEFHGQLFSTLEFTKLLFDVIANLRGMKSMKLINLDFRERIMLAVTKVNDCIYCENYHSKMATQSGISREELDFMLNNQFTSAPENQLKALIFAQSYAKMKGKMIQSDLDNLYMEYSDQSKGILSAIRMIMIGNSYGIAFYALRQRLKLKKIKNSWILNELGVLISPILSVLLLIIICPFQKLIVPNLYYKGVRLLK